VCQGAHAVSETSKQRVTCELCVTKPELKLYACVRVMARLKDRLKLGRYPIGIPTLRGFPPAAPIRHPSQRPPSQRRAAPISSVPLPIRSRSYRRQHDCLFVPNFEELAELVDARRGIRRLASAADAQQALQRQTRFTSPLAIGLALAFMPPVAVALVWSSPHFGFAAKVAVTVYGAGTFALMIGAVIALIHG